MIKSLQSCSESTSKLRRKEERNINVTVKEIIFTPLACASIINEVIRCLLYQKSQIPYPYNWLKSVVTRRRKQTENETDLKPTNIIAEQHYKTVSIAYDSLEELTKNLSLEFRNYDSFIRQINILGLATHHLEENHVSSNNKNQHKILKNIVLSEEWIKAMDVMLPPTNMYIMIQKVGNVERKGQTNYFEQNDGYTLPSTANITNINLSYSDKIDDNCCSNLSIFVDSSKEQSKINNFPNNDTISNGDYNILWYQANSCIKGFKECYINKVSATELW